MRNCTIWNSAWLVDTSPPIRSGTDRPACRHRFDSVRLHGTKQGEEIPYWTRPGTLGVDDGEIATTLVVEWATASGAGKLRSDRLEWPKKLRIFRTAMESCLRTSGAPARPDVARQSGWEGGDDQE